MHMEGSVYCFFFGNTVKPQLPKLCSEICEHIKNVYIYSIYCYMLWLGCMCAGCFLVIVYLPVLGVLWNTISHCPSFVPNQSDICADQECKNVYPSSFVLVMYKLPSTQVQVHKSQACILDICLDFFSSSRYRPSSFWKKSLSAPGSTCSSRVASTQGAKMKS